jgi:hypothetical protein
MALDLGGLKKCPEHSTWMKNIFVSSMRKLVKAEAAYWLLILVFFIFFFWPATLAGRFFVGGDALVYSYPLRMAAWEMIRQGQWPLWTPTLLSGYPLLAMSQLALGYPLTWGYLFLSGHAAEQIYVLAPYLLAPLFTFIYARQIGRSRPAALLAGFTFGYGGLMASQIATFGILTNAVMWLPLVLTAVERARSKPFLTGALGMTAAYAMSVLSGLGQGFLYVGIVAVSYSAFLAFLPTPGDEQANLKLRLRPLMVCIIGIVLAAGVGAFQILETMQAQQQSIRSKLSYQMFSGGSFTFAGAWQSFFAPFYHFIEEETFVVLFAALLAGLAVFTSFKLMKQDRRILFWLSVAALSFVLMLGDNTPLYRLLYHVPVLNLFRVPGRHAFEWTLSLGILAAFGWDQLAVWLHGRAEDSPRRWPLIAGLILAAGVVALGYGWWVATGKPSTLTSDVNYTGLSERGWLWWKGAFTLAAVIAAVWTLSIVKGRGKTALAVFLIAVACFVEPYIMLQRWWFHFARDASYFTDISAPTKFLQQYAPQENRIYTSLTMGYIFDLPRTEPHNITSRRGFHNAAGYEPLMSARYDKAFGNRGNFDTPDFSSPLDKQILKDNWQVLDLLNVRFLAEFSVKPPGFTEKEGTRFAAGDAAVNLEPKARTILSGGSGPVDTLTFLSTLANSGHLNNGQTAAKINIYASDGRVISRELQAGRDSAEWAHERADVKQNIKHSLARVFDSRPGDEQNTFPAYRYWSRFDLGEKLNIERIEIVNTDEIASVILSKASAYDAAGNQVFLLSQRLPEQWRKVYDHDNVQIYENLRQLPRTWLVPQGQAVGEEEALRRIRGEGEPFDPRKLALLEANNQANVAFLQGEFNSQAEARVVSYASDRLAVETGADKPGVLVVSEINYPGWEATVDGQPATIFTTNYLLRGVILPEGKHRVEMHYAAPAARRGAIISLLTLLALAAAQFLGGSKSDRSTALQQSP